ncbi:MAG: PAS domain-containing protein, partial [Bacteriovoracaceae bacterium]|nr:PAS domain-containing protein [Bacteriovoracaceae bacterium]
VPNPKEIDPKMNVLLWAILIFGIVFSVSIYFSLRYYFLSIDRLEKEKMVSSSLESILLFVPVGVFKADLKGNYLWVNQSWMDKTGISEKEAAGQGWQKAIHPEDRLAVYQEWEDSIRDGREFDLTFRIINTAYQMIKSSKEILWVHTKTTYLKDDEGNITSILGSMMDISRERAVQETMRLQQLKLVQADKMTTLGEMAASIAHEVNNPLTIIQSSVENMYALKEANKLDDEKFFDLTKKITQTVERAGKIIRGLKTFARDGSNDPMQVLKVQTVIHDSLDFCTTRFKKNGVELRVSAIPSDWLINCRSVQIEQVLLNLLTNAFDSIRSLPEPWISVSVRDAGDRYEISVEDSGPGISEEISKKIMEPFFTTKPVGQGTGLGLSISRNIINEHGGELRLVRREPNPKFIFDIPKAKG